MARNFYRTIQVVVLLFMVDLAVKAEQLPLKAYTTADGLPHNVINKIVRDSRGFLWFCTDDGLARFDGYEFTNFGTEQGLPHAVVNDLLEARDGEYWVATNGGLCIFNPNGVAAQQVAYADKLPPNSSLLPMFIVVTPASDDRYTKSITTLLQARDGTIWYGTRNGVFSVTMTKPQVTIEPVNIGLANDYPEQRDINALLEDRFGALWFGGPDGLRRRWPDGAFVRYGKRDGLPDDNIHDLLEDHDGNLWVATRFGGLFQLATSAGHEAPVVKRTYNVTNALGTDWVFDLFASSDDKLWVGTNAGLAEFSLKDEKQRGPLHVYTKRNGFSYHEIANIAEDRDGNLWLGTINGAMKLSRGGFTTFNERDGVCCVRSFFRSPAGEFYAYANVNPDQVPQSDNSAVPYTLNLGHLDREHFTWLMPDALKNKHLAWSPQPTALQSRTGEWWIGTGEGLFRFPPQNSFSALKNAKPIANYTTRDGLATMEVFCIYEDSRGDLWVSTVGSNGNGLARWERATRTLHNVAQMDSLPSLKEKLPTAFSEDAVGDLWVGFSQGELARYRDGRFKLFTTADGLPTGRVDDLFRDRAGRLWIAIRRGLVRVDDPTAERPSFVTYTTTQGLSSNYVSTITQDHSGMMYIGTGQGVDRLDPTNGRIKHYTTADGLALGDVATAACDRDGAIWIGTSAGFSRLQPEATQSSDAPPVFIKGLSIAGTSHHVSAIGETAILLADLSPNQNQLQIDFVGLSFAPGEVLRYQYRLEGAKGDWTTPSTQRTINFANLAPGSYRFLVRAVNAEGVASTRSATIAFVILRPIWQRWWFLSLSGIVVALIAYELYRYRLARLLELERIRTRIATDLHDDIGSSLSQIAILSEVVRQKVGDNQAAVAEPLSQITTSSSELMDTMSDIVWAIDPHKDQLADLIQRMRRFASDVLTARNIDFEFNAPDAQRKLNLSADVRRQAFLVFKETLNNAVRHSACSRVVIDFRVNRHSCKLSIRDDGRGFDPDRESDGHGLVNMRQRARQLGGSLTVISQPNEGTSVVFEAPISVQRKTRIG
jgi:ligand-binding sensor domain-containing protein/signal transduction histidine kinase